MKISHAWLTLNRGMSDQAGAAVICQVMQEQPWCVWSSRSSRYVWVGRLIFLSCVHGAAGIAYRVWPHSAAVQCVESVHAVAPVRASLFTQLPQCLQDVYPRSCRSACNLSTQLGQCVHGVCPRSFHSVWSFLTYLPCRVELQNYLNIYYYIFPSEQLR